MSPTLSPGCVIAPCCAVALIRTGMQVALQDGHCPFSSSASPSSSAPTTDAPTTESPTTETPTTTLSPTTGTPTTCFPATATVQTRTRGTVPLYNVSVGEQVLAQWQGALVYSPVLYFQKQVAHGDSPYVEVLTETGSAVRLSHDHLIFAGNPPVAVPASELAVNASVWVARGEVLEPARAVSKRVVMDRGAYNAVTLSGTMIVDGVLASCFTTNPITRNHDTMAYYHREVVHGLGLTWLGQAMTWLSRVLVEVGVSKM